MSVIHTINSKYGFIEISAPKEHILIAKPKGYISPTMIIQDLKVVQNYGILGFDYYEELRGFVIPHPINFFNVRKLQEIHNLRTYTIVTDSLFPRLGFGLFKPFVKYTEIIGTPEFEYRLEP